jgi:hypothetical protein
LIRPMLRRRARLKGHRGSPSEIPGPRSVSLPDRLLMSPTALHSDESQPRLRARPHRSRPSDDWAQTPSVARATRGVSAAAHSGRIESHEIIFSPWGPWRERRESGGTRGGRCSYFSREKRTSKGPRAFRRANSPARPGASKDARSWRGAGSAASVLCVKVCFA